METCAEDSQTAMQREGLVFVKEPIRNDISATKIRHLLLQVCYCHFLVFPFAHTSYSLICFFKHLKGTVCDSFCFFYSGSNFYFSRPFDATSKRFALLGL
jgi:hypothetical protein